MFSQNSKKSSLDFNRHLKKNNDNKTKHKINMEMSVTAISGELKT